MPRCSQWPPPSAPATHSPHSLSHPPPPPAFPAPSSRTSSPPPPRAPAAQPLTWRADTSRPPPKPGPGRLEACIPAVPPAHRHWSCSRAQRVGGSLKHATYACPPPSSPSRGHLACLHAEDPRRSGIWRPPARHLETAGAFAFKLVGTPCVVLYGRGGGDPPVSSLLLAPPVPPGSAGPAAAQASKLAQPSCAASTQRPATPAGCAHRAVQRAWRPGGAC